MSKKDNISQKEIDTLNQKLALRLRNLRIQKGHTSAENFAYEAGIGRVQYWRYEKGQSDIRFSSLVKVLHGLDTNLKEFFSEGFD